MEEVAPCLTSADKHGVAQPIPFGVSEQPDVGHCLRSGASKADKHESTTYIAQPVGFNARQDPDHWPERTGPLDTDGSTQAVAFAQNTRDEVREMPYVGALAAQSGMKQTTYIRNQMAVRRLTPVECERLQGFPDGYTNIPWRKADQSPDGPRYKALGNSMAVPVMAWIGRRIRMYNTHSEGMVV